MVLIERSPTQFELPTMTDNGGYNRDMTRRNGLIIFTDTSIGNDHMLRTVVRDPDGLLSDSRSSKTSYRCLTGGFDIRAIGDSYCYQKPGHDEVIECDGLGILAILAESDLDPRHSHGIHTHLSYIGIQTLEEIDTTD